VESLTHRRTVYSQVISGPRENLAANGLAPFILVTGTGLLSPLRGSANLCHGEAIHGLLRRCAPRNDGSGQEKGPTREPTFFGSSGALRIFARSPKEITTIEIPLLNTKT
jgi:hypothetical protein